mgnify:CR=1 FL=1
MAWPGELNVDPIVQLEMHSTDRHSAALICLSLDRLRAFEYRSFKYEQNFNISARGVQRVVPQLQHLLVACVDGQLKFLNYVSKQIDDHIQLRQHGFFSTLDEVGAGQEAKLVHSLTDKVCVLLRSKIALKCSPQDIWFSDTLHFPDLFDKDTIKAWKDWRHVGRNSNDGRAAEQAEDGDGAEASRSACLKSCV